MYKCQQALIKHLKSKFSDTVKTIDEYAGQIKDAHKLTQLCPAALVLFKEGNPLKNKEFNFDILVITLNRVLDRKENLKGNLRLVSDIADYLNESYLFAPADGSAGRYEIFTDEAKAETVLNDNMFCIVALSLPIKFHS